MPEDGSADHSDRGRPKITRADAWRLVWATYTTSFPYLLIFLIGMLAATWFVTTILFR